MVSSEAASEPRAVTRLKCDHHRCGDEGKGSPGSSSILPGGLVVLPP